MTYESLIKEFIGTFPELKDKAEEEAKWWDGEIQLVHVFFSTVLNRFLVKELTSLENPKILARVFNFLESMAVSEDEGVQEVLVVTTLEYLSNYEVAVKNAKPLMLPNTRKLYDAMEKWYDDYKKTHKQ